MWSSGLGLHLARAVDVRGLKVVAARGAITAVRRRGKYITVVIAGEDQPRADDRGVCIHLGMTGRLRVQPAAAPRAPHTHVVFTLDDVDELRFVDARRFGWVAPGAPLATLPGLSELGPDPLTELDEAALALAMTDGARAPIKAFLLDQHRVAGLGNIYVCEALFLAGIHPTTPAGRVRRRAPALLAAIRETLEGGIARRGTTLRDYVDAGRLRRATTRRRPAGLRPRGPTLPDLRRGDPPRASTPRRSTFYCPRSCRKR